MFVNLDFVIWKYVFYLCISEALDLVMQKISDLSMSMNNILVVLEASCTSVAVFLMAHLPVYTIDLSTLYSIISYFSVGEDDSQELQKC